MIILPISFTPKLVICFWKQLVKMTSATTEQKLKNPCMLPQYIYLSSMLSLNGLLFQWRTPTHQSHCWPAAKRTGVAREINLFGFKHWNLRIVCYENITWQKLTKVLRITRTRYSGEAIVHNYLIEYYKEKLLDFIGETAANALHKRL